MDHENLPDGYHTAPDGTVWVLPGAPSVKGWQWFDDDEDAWRDCAGTYLATDGQPLKVRRKPVPMATVPADVLERLEIDSRYIRDRWRGPQEASKADRDLARAAIAKARSEQA